MKSSRQELADPRMGSMVLHSEIIITAHSKNILGIKIKIQVTVLVNISQSLKSIGTFENHSLKY